MTAVSRLGDESQGHGCWPPKPSIQASDNVFVNGIPVHRLGDRWQEHTCPDIPETHGSVLAQGSDNVFVNGLSIARIGDLISCGDHIAQGSDNVFAN